MQSHGLLIDTIHTPTPFLCHFTVSLSTVFNAASCATPSGSITFTEDARIEPRTVATLALFVRPSNDSAGIRPHFYHSQQAMLISSGVGFGGAYLTPL